MMRRSTRFVVESDGRRIVVDTCVGNDKDRGDRGRSNQLQRPFLDDLRAAGFAPESIDTVVCTHLHVDHVGWNTRLDDGRWVPTFPHARYLFAPREWEHWSATNEDAHAARSWPTRCSRCSTPGLADLVEMRPRVTDEVWLEPTPGHTPGHVSVRLALGRAARRSSPAT